jgi:putative transposase
MKPTQHTAEQIIRILEQAEKGAQTVAAICREHGIAENTFYRWRKAYGGMSVSEVQRLKELEKENARLKRLLAERMLEVDALKELLAKKSPTIAEQRDAVQFLAMQGISVRRACALVHIQRATFQYQERPRPDDEALLADSAVLAQENPRYGYRRIWALLRRKRPINRKRVHRLWKRASSRSNAGLGGEYMASRHRRCWQRRRITFGRMTSLRIAMSMARSCAS